MHATRRYSTGFIVAVACCIVAAGIINTWVDPLRLTNQSWANPDFDPYREISSQIRSGKAGMLRQAGELDAAFIGSSRVANGMDPAFHAWDDRKVLNLGCSGGFIFESVAIATHLINQDRCDLILLGVDPGDLTSSIDTRPLGDFFTSPFNPDGDAVDREIRYWVGISTLEQSLETIERKQLDRPATYNSKGLRVRRKGGRGIKQLDFIRSNILGEAFLADDSPHSQQLNPTKIEALRRLLRHARTIGVEMIVYLHPRHALLGADRKDLASDTCPYISERRALAELVDEVNSLPSEAGRTVFWDFLDYHPITTESLPLEEGTSMQFWSDLDHFSVEVGNAMQSRMMGWPVELAGASEFGSQVTLSTLEDHLSQIREGYQEYLRNRGSRDITWKEAAAANAP